MRVLFHLGFDDLTEVASFQQKMSIIAARHICMGEWHNAFLDLEADFSLWIPTGAANFQLAQKLHRFGSI